MTMTPDPYLLQQSAQCQHCHIWFRWTITRDSYCSDGCKAHALHKKRMLERSKATDIKSPSTGSAGAVGELLVCTDLINRGYHVFRAIAADCYCDLMARKAARRRIMQIEVRTGRMRGNNFMFPWNTRHGVNCMAVYNKDTGTIHYFDPFKRQPMEM